MPLLMGIVNVTPDSFSDGGHYRRAEAAIAHGVRLLEEGADCLDIGGESTRPGADPVDCEEEIGRVIPVIRGILNVVPEGLISIDTSKASVAAAAIEAGARWVNDVTALGHPDMASVVAEAGVDVVLMHMRGTPRTMQADTHYDDLVGEVCAGLAERMAVAEAAGIDRARIWLDPGVGFGKALEDNPRLIANVPRFRALGARVLIGASRKRFIGALTGVEQASERVYGSVGAALAAAARGADALRVHDVGATKRALAVFLPCMEETT